MIVRANLEERRTQLLEQLQQHSVACEQIRGALALCEELLKAHETHPDKPTPPTAEEVEEPA